MAPIIPASAEHRGNTLMALASVQVGSGFSDQYLGFTGIAAGNGFPALPNPMGTTPAPVYTPNIDPGMVTYDLMGNLHTIDWTLYLFGVQYYLPPNGNVWFSGNFANEDSGNIASFGIAPASVYTKAMWFDTCLFWQVTPAIRFGAEYAQYRQTYADRIEATGENTEATSHRLQFTGWFIF
jgi:hypothetical protein